jgi:hypothetical protein
MLRRTIDAEDAVDHDPDPVGDSLDVGQNVRAEKNRPSFALNHVDQRHEKLTARYRIEADHRIVQDQQVGVRRDGERQGDVRPLSVRKTPDFLAERQFKVVENLFQQLLIPPMGVERADEIDGLSYRHPSVLSLDWDPLQRLRMDHQLHPAIDEMAAGGFQGRSPPEIVGSGHVVRSLEAALWAFHDAEDFREAVLNAVNSEMTPTRPEPFAGSCLAPIGALRAFPENGSLDWPSEKNSKQQFEP